MLQHLFFRYTILYAIRLCLPARHQPHSNSRLCNTVPNNPHTFRLCCTEVKAYVTLNTLVFDHELFDSPSDLMRAGSGSAIEALRLVAEAKVDALIVQDIGLALAPCL